jgi:diguanylate cyclase (GGDEF)-like protein
LVEIVALKKELHRLQQQIAHSLWHDEVTGLPNRRFLEAYLADVVTYAEYAQTAVWVGMLDVEQFARVNDTYGHVAGDEVLKEIAHRLTSAMGDTALLARWGGDELVMVWAEGRGISNRDAFISTVDRLQHAMAPPFDVMPGEQIELTMSMGVAEYPLHGENGDALLREAEKALYQQKRAILPHVVWWQWSKRNQSLALPRFSFPIEAMVTQVEEVLANHSIWHAVVESLNVDEQEIHHQQRINHLTWLLYEANETTAIHERAMRVGEVHALVGLAGDVVMQATATYMRMVTQTIQHQNEMDSMTWISTFSRRVQADAQGQLQAMEQTLIKYLKVLTPQLDGDDMSVPKRMRQGLGRISELPGLLGALWIELDLEQGFVVKITEGKQGDAIAAETSKIHHPWVSYTSATSHDSLLLEAWQCGTIQSVSSYQHIVRFQAWHSAAQRIGVRSMLMVPILDEARHTVAMVGLYGAYPHQFESPWMQVFAQGVQYWVATQYQQMANG